jgi:hypothetical protein
MEQMDENESFDRILHHLLHLNVELHKIHYLLKLKEEILHAEFAIITSKNHNFSQPPKNIKTCALSPLLSLD